ncbi:hypothetical protein LTR08_006579 [Meristemomyces frigidus]|nr:hypothetical protein LTR08_006579 [Meristemomyces frigidus]
MYPPINNYYNNSERIVNDLLNDLDSAFCNLGFDDSNACASEAFKDLATSYCQTDHFSDDDDNEKTSNQHARAFVHEYGHDFWPPYGGDRRHLQDPWSAGGFRHPFDRDAIVEKMEEYYDVLIELLCHEPNRCEDPNMDALVEAFLGRPGSGHTYPDYDDNDSSDDDGCSTTFSDDEEDEEDDGLDALNQQFNRFGL